MAINGLVVMTPTSIASTGSGNSSSINADGSVDFSSCATLSLNGVFTSSYDNYMIAMRLSSTDTGGIQVRFRASGTNNTTASSYVTQYISASSTSVTGARLTDSFGYIAGARNTQRSGSTAFIFGPYLAQPTAWRNAGADDLSSAAIIDYAGTHNQSVAYDGFSLIVPTWTISGLLTVFGFNQ